MDSVVHFEMPYENRERMAKFYQSAFGWQTQMLGEDMGNYVVATTTETTDAGPTKPGAINGGFYGKKPDWPMQYPSVVIAVDDVKRSIAEGHRRGRQGARRADGDPGRRAVRVVRGPGGQPGEHAAAAPAERAGPQVGQGGRRASTRVSDAPPTPADWVGRSGGDAPAGRWRAFRALLSAPHLPRDLR